MYKYINKILRGMSLLFAFPHLTNDIIPKTPDWKTGNEPKCVSYAQTQQRISHPTDTIFKLASGPHVTCPKKLGQSWRSTTLLSPFPLHSPQSPHTD